MSQSAFQSYVDQPRYRVTINGDQVDQVITVSINNNNYYKPDSFTLSLYYNADAEKPPAWWSGITTQVDASNTAGTAAANQGLSKAEIDFRAESDAVSANPSISASQAQAAEAAAEAQYAASGPVDLSAATVIIYFGFVTSPPIASASPGAGSSDNIQWSQMLVGQIDGLEIDADSFRIDLTGRDLSSRLVDTKTTNTYSNKTSSQIAAILAAAHNLPCQITATTTIVGRYYQSQHDSLQQDNFSRITTDWDLLVYLAQQETDANGNPFAVYMNGGTLVFGPRFEDSSAPIDIFYYFEKNAPSSATISKLHMRWVLTLAKDITVIVKSWSSLHEREFTRTARSNHSGRSGSASGVTGQQYVVIIPNLTSDQALARAQAILTQQSLHERSIDFEMPLNFTLSPRNRFQLSGTGTDFDTVYYVDEIARTLAGGSNQRQWVKCRNSRPGYEVDVG